VEVWQTSNLRRLRIWRGKKEERRKKVQGKNIMACPITYGGHKKKPQGKNMMSASATQGGHNEFCDHSSAL